MSYLYIGDNFRISADSYNFNVEQFTKTKPKQRDKDGIEKWIHIGYYSSLAGACKGILKHHMKDIEKDNLRDFLWELNQIEKRIEEAVKHIKVIERKEDQRGKHKREKKGE